MAHLPDQVNEYRLTPPSGGLLSRVLTAAQRCKYRLLIKSLSRPGYLRFLRFLMAVARTMTPVLRISGVNLTLTHAHTKALLEQSDDFQVTAGLSDRLPAGYFLMDIDWPRQHAEEKALVEVGLGLETSAMDYLQAYAEERCEHYVRACNGGELNVARDFTEELTLDVVHEYFGIGDNTHDMREELRLIFRLLASQIFQSAPVGGERALKTMVAQDRLLEITKNESDRSRDTVLTRLERAAAEAETTWATGDWAARNAAGLAAFGSGTVARAATQITYRLLTLDGADEAAGKVVEAYVDHRSPENRARVLQVAMEALRFNPMLPLMGVRQATRRSELYALCPHARRRVDPGEVFIPSPFAAMFDARAFPRPGEFRTEQRQLSDYLHFGHGRHICVGKRVAEVLLEEVVIALFNRRKPSCKGVIKYDGPAVETLKVTFDA